MIASNVYKYNKLNESFSYVQLINVELHKKLRTTKARNEDNEKKIKNTFDEVQ